MKSSFYVIMLIVLRNNRWHSNNNLETPHTLIRSSAGESANLVSLMYGVRILEDAVFYVLLIIDAEMRTVSQKPEDGVLLQISVHPKLTTNIIFWL